jgi:hypothetical protein
LRAPERWQTTAGFGTAALGFCLLLSGVALAAPTVKTKAPNLIATYNVLSVQCEPAAGGTVRARVTVRMRVVNYDNVKDWAQRMKVKGRLIPTTAGLSYTRPWAEKQSDYLTQNRTHTQRLTIVTDNVTPRASWNAQLKLFWDRPAPIPDVVKETSKSFSCGGGGVSMGG